jgi:hypothetical protein
VLVEPSLSECACACVQSLVQAAGAGAIDNIVNMGRLRNLSASFKAAAFSNGSSLSFPALSKTSTNGQTQLVDKDYPSPTTFEDSPAPTENPRTTPRTDRAASRPTSMVYTPPSMDYEREQHIEELRPVFRYASPADF